MLERIMLFLPSILIVASIALATLIYLRWITKKFGKNLNSVEWCEKNKWKLLWTIGTPTINIWGPTFEELIFRAPLVIAFGTMSSFAWYGVLGSASLFALMHWSGKMILFSEILSARREGSHESDSMGVEAERLYKKNGKTMIVRRVLHVVATLPLGILAGYYGIKYQSIWVSVGIHSLWNLVMPVILPLFALAVFLAFDWIVSLRSRVMSKKQRWRIG